MENVVALAELFVSRVIAAAQQAAVERAQAALATAFGTTVRRGPGRPKKQPAPMSFPTKGNPTQVTSKVSAARKLQGQYLGALRGLSAVDRVKVKAVAKKKGVAAAVRMAKGLKNAR